MENSSKALILAGEILIGVIILTIFAIVITSFATSNNQYKEQMTAKEIKAFNLQFLKYVEYDSKGQAYMAAPNIVTIANLADEINDKYGFTAMKIWSNVTGGTGITYDDMNGEMARKYFYDKNGNLRKNYMYREIIGTKKVVTLYYEVYISNTTGYTSEGRLRRITIFLHPGSVHYKDDKGQFKKF